MASGSHQVRALLHSVVYASSSEQYIQDQKTLVELFKEPGFFLVLQEYASDRSLSQPERLMASVISGRELRTKWRSKALVPEARRPEVRQRLFSFLEEEDLGIARPQLGLLVAVARIELPKHFPNLPQLLLNPLLDCLAHLDGNAPPPSPAITTVLLNTLWTINALVKEWRTVKLTAGAEVMKTLENVFIDPVGKVLDLWAERERRGESNWVIEEAGRYAFKVLARFNLWHFGKAKSLQKPEAIQRIHVLVHHTVHHAPIIQSHRLKVISTLPGSSSPEQSKLLKSLIKHLRAIGKWWRAMIAIAPKSFCEMEGVTQGVGWWWGEVGTVVSTSEGTVADSDDDDSPHPKRFLLMGMLLFKDILPILAVDHRSIFTPEFVLSALHLLVDKLLPLTTSDLEGLNDEPEEWFIRESTDEEAWAFEFRPCAERVLIALNNACRHFPPEQRVIEPEMLKMLHETESTPPSDLPSILRRESIYCAMGRLSRSLSTFGGIDFQQFLQGTNTWFSQSVPLHRILKRRLAWLIGQWVTSEEECAKLDIIWQILLHLISERGESTDTAVNLSAVVAIKECVDLWELDISYFTPHLEKTTSELIKLLGEVETLDGKRYINEAIGVVIDRTDDKIMPFLPNLARSIPGLWHGAASLEGEWLFKASLVVLTTKLVSAAKTSSGQLMELVIPLIEESLVPPAKDFFEEDGLALWQTALYNSVSPYEPTPETGLSRLLPGLLNVLGENLDLLESLLRLLDSYLLLDASNITQHYGASVCGTISKALGASKANSDGIRRLLATVALMIRTSPITELGPHLLSSGIFQHVLTALEDDKASGMILAAYLEILARIVLAEPNAFLHMISEAARMANRPNEKVLDEVLDAMWRNFDYVGDARSRKAIAMAAGRLLTTGQPLVMERLDGEFMNIFLDVLGELAESQDEITGAETSVKPWRDEHQTQWAEIKDTAEGDRRNRLEDGDPAFGTPLKGFLIDTLGQAQSVGIGPYWDKADAGAKNSLQKFLS